MNLTQLQASQVVIHQLMRVGLLAIVLVANVRSAFAADAVTITVAPDQDLQKVFDQLKNSESSVTVQFSKGTYRLKAPVVLGPEHKKITLESVPGETAKIIGTRLLSDSKASAEFPGLWETPLPKPPKDGWLFRRIFHEGRGILRSRTPNTGWLEHKEDLPPEGPFVMHVTPNLLVKDWGERGNVMLCALQKWAGFKLPIEKVDVTQNLVTLPQHPVKGRQEASNRFWIENAVEAIDLPGEWAIDRAGNRLIWMPFANQDPDKTVLAIPVMPLLIRMKGCEDITIRNLDFSECGDDFRAGGEIDYQAAANRRGAIYMTRCSNCLVEYCRFFQINAYALDFGEGCKNNKVRYVTCQDMGAGGIRIGEPIRTSSKGELPDWAKPQEVLVTGHTVEDCTITRYSQLDYGAVAVIAFQATHNRFVHNEISDSPYTAISTGWTYGYGETLCDHNIIEYNHIHHIGNKLLSDIGGVYTLGRQTATLVRNNLIHDFHCYDYGAWGLYTDEGSADIVFENNVVYDCESAGFHQHYGRDNLIKNNLFVNCGEGAIRRSREEHHISFTLERNVIVNQTADFLKMNWGNKQVKIHKNLYFSPDSTKPPTFGGKSWYEWKNMGYDRDSTLANPMLIDPKHPETGLKKNSPATAIGFKMPDLSHVGPRPQTGGQEPIQK